MQKIMTSLPDVVMNGDQEHHYPGVDMPFLSLCWKSLSLLRLFSQWLFLPGCINLSFAYVEGESLLMALKDVALSSGR